MTNAFALPLLDLGTGIIALAFVVVLIFVVLLVVKFGSVSPVVDEYTMRLRRWFLAQIGLAIVLAFVFAPDIWAPWARWTAITGFIIVYVYSLYRFPKKLSQSTKPDSDEK